MTRILGLFLACAVTLGLYYISRFWEFRLWQGALFGFLRPQGDLVPLWLRGTGLGPFALVLWFLGAILILTLLQKLWDALTPKS